MVKKLQKTAARKAAKPASRFAALGNLQAVTDMLNGKLGSALNERLNGNVRESAQQIWAAGMGAFTKAQSEGGKMFETLVKEGIAMQKRTQAMAEERISEVTNKMSHAATDISTKASAQFDRLEGIFEERVAKALNKLGVPSSKDINELVARINELNKAVQKLGAAAPKKAPVKAAGKPVAKKAPAKKAAPRKAAAKKAA
jgi:poly(hydroxyalkanoate) granule-associated protein